MFGFLGQLGSAIGSGVASGAKATGGMFAKGFKKLGELQDGGGMPPMSGPGGTGGFAGNDGLPQVGGLINRRNPMQDRMPVLQRPDTPPMEPLRGSAETVGMLPEGQVRASNASLPTSIAERPVASVRPPDFLRGRGATMDDTPMNHARYGYQTEHMQEGRIPRRWQDIAMNAIHGAAQGFQQTGDLAGALGGGIAGSAGSAISPLHGRDFRFQMEQMPRLSASQAESERLEDRGYERQKRTADMEGVRARTAATIAGTKDAELERRKLQSAIALNDARAKAVATGKLQKHEEYDPVTGEIRVVYVRPDGTEVEDAGGLSGGAQVKREGIEAQNQRADKQIQSREGIVDKQIGSREKIVNIQQRGATGRTAMTQAGQNQRQRERLGAGGDIPAVGSVPYGPPTPSSEGSPRRQAIIQRAIDAGYTREQAIAEANKRGIQ